MIQETPDIPHKRGDAYSRIVTIPSDFADGYFSGWTVKAQLKDSREKLIADFVCAWVDDVTTRHLRVSKFETQDWPVEALRWDIQFTRTSDGWIASTNTVVLHVLRDETQ